MNVRYYPVQIDANSGVIIHSEQGLDTYTDAGQKVYEENAAENIVGYSPSWDVVMVEHGSRDKFYLLGQQGVRDISGRLLAVTADDRIHESVPAHPEWGRPA